MNIQFLEDQCPMHGVVKKTTGTVVQVFDDQGNCIRQAFIAGDDESEYEAPEGVTPLSMRVTAYEKFYHPFEMADPRSTCPGFSCPKCKSVLLEEIMTDVTMKSRVVSIEGGDIEYGVTSAGDSGEVSRYQCADCGCVVAHSDTELFAKYDKTP